MLTNRLYRTAPTSGRGGFTLVELLVVIGIIAILAGVALGPITNGIKQAKHNAAMQTGRQIGQMCFSYSTDNTQNGNAYPADATGKDIANDLLNNSYATDPSPFYVSGQDTTVMSNYKMPASPTPAAMTANNCSWSFTVAATNTTGGITSNASDLTPLVYFNNGPGTGIVTSVQGSAPSAKPSGTLTTNAPFGTDGVAVFYKGNNALYLKATSAIVQGFIGANDTDTTAYQVAP